MKLVDGNISINTTKVTFLKADAEVNIRKGKQYLVYEFEIEAEFRAEDEADEVNGTYVVKEICGDDLDGLIV